MLKYFQNCIKYFRNYVIYWDKSILNFDKKMYGEECAICLEIFEELDDDLLYCTLKCGHSYHKTCINEWLSKDKSCPNCRIEFK